jgi:hypothetical protein
MLSGLFLFRGGKLKLAVGRVAGRVYFWFQASTTGTFLETCPVSTLSDRIEWWVG